MANVSDVLNVARGEIGYKESANNNTKYGAEYGLNYNPWCVMFIWWVFNRAGAGALFYGGGKVALCSALYNYHRARGQAVSAGALQAGDIVFFDFSGKKTATDHVGIVESVSGSTVVTIEGNTSAGSGGNQANGEGVYRRNRSTSLISRAYRPAYNGTGNAAATVSAGNGYSLSNFVRDVQARIGAGVDGIAGSETLSKAPMLSTGSNRKHAVVATLQVCLFSLGYKFPQYGADGDFGAETTAAVKAYQSANGLSADGIVGRDTWRKLLGI